MMGSQLPQILETEPLMTDSEVKGFEWSIRSACGRYYYHLGIIDILQRYNMAKRSERFAKTTLLCCKNRKDFGKNDLSVIGPEQYKTRFIQFCRNIVFANIE